MASVVCMVVGDNCLIGVGWMSNCCACNILSHWSQIKAWMNWKSWWYSSLGVWSSVTQRALWLRRWRACKWGTNTLSSHTSSRWLTPLTMFAPTTGHPLRKCRKSELALLHVHMYVRTYFRTITLQYVWVCARSYWLCLRPSVSGMLKLSVKLHFAICTTSPRRETRCTK